MKNSMIFSIISLCLVMNPCCVADDEQGSLIVQDMEPLFPAELTLQNNDTSVNIVRIVHHKMCKTPVTDKMGEHLRRQLAASPQPQLGSVTVVMARNILTRDCLPQMTLTATYFLTTSNKWEFIEVALYWERNLPSLKNWHSKIFSGDSPFFKIAAGIPFKGLTAPTVVRVELSFAEISSRRDLSRCLGYSMQVWGRQHEAESACFVCALSGRDPILDIFNNVTQEAGTSIFRREPSKIIDINAENIIDKYFWYAVKRGGLIDFERQKKGAQTTKAVKPKGK